MMPRNSRQHSLFVLLPCIVLAFACGDALPPTAAVPADPVQLARTSTGLLLPHTVLEDNVADLARAIAVALSEPALRARVHHALAASPFPEGKLRVAALLQNDSVRLLSTLAAGSGRSPSAVMAKLDSVPDLEIYLPVDAHRQAWTGDGSLLVMSFPNDDGAVAHAFNLAGLEVPVSLEVPPPVPTIVLTAVESDYFSAEARATAATKANAVLTSYADSAVFMSGAVIPGGWDPWPAGDPEFEVHTFMEDIDAIYKDEICSSELRPSFYNWNMDGITWSGQVMLATQVFLGETLVQYQMWENDSDACSGETDGRPPKTSSGNISDLSAWPSLIHDIYKEFEEPPGTSWWAVISISTKAVGALYNLNENFNEDEFVGLFEGPVNGCFPAGGSAAFALRPSDGGQSNGTAYVFYTYGEQTICPLRVDIQGPSTVYNCRVGESDPSPDYEAAVFSGVGTIVYEWREDGELNSGSGPSYTFQDLSVGTHRLDLIVTRGNESDGDHIFINVEEGDDQGGGCNA